MTDLFKRVSEALQVFGNKTQLLSLHRELLEAFEANRQVVETWLTLRDSMAASDIAETGKASDERTYDGRLVKDKGLDITVYKRAWRNVDSIKVYLDAIATHL